MRHHQLTVRPRAVDDAGQPDINHAAEALARRLAPMLDDSMSDEQRERLEAALAKLIDKGELAALCVESDFVIEGDFHMFNWLSQAAGPAGAGFLGNNAETTDGSGHWLVLEPEQPERQQRSRSRLAHRELRA